MTSMPTVSGGFLGVIMLDTRLPRPPGDIYSLATCARADNSVRFVTVAGASARGAGLRSGVARPLCRCRPLQGGSRRPVDHYPLRFSRSLANRAAGAVDVPVITSSLLQCARLSSPGILIFDSASLHAGLLQRADVSAGTPLEGLRPGCELQSRIPGDDTQLDLRQASDDVVAAVMRLVARNPEARHLALECTNMPPYRAAVVQANGRSLHDLDTSLPEAWPKQRATN